ncbi:30S ribosomal protein S5 [bacterium]|nr:30S ribosomal protein S5 [bacterium]
MDTTEKKQPRKNNQQSNYPKKDNIEKGVKIFSKNRPDNRGGFRKGGPRGNDRKDEFEQRILDIARVTRVMAGGKRMSFRVCVAIGDKKGRVGVGLGKGADVAIAVNKAVNRAKRDMITVSIINETIPHEIKEKHGAAQIFLKPAKAGSGVIAGGIVRVILELAGIKNISGKILGTNNKMNNAFCTLEILKNLRKVDSADSKEGRDKNVDKKKVENKEKK